MYLAFLKQIFYHRTEEYYDWCFATNIMDIRVRYFLFAYEQLIESIWYLFYHEEVSFKRYLIELSEACTTMVNSEERKERTRKQS